MGVGQLATVAFGYIFEKKDGSSKETKRHTFTLGNWILRAIFNKARRKLENSCKIPIYGVI